MDEKQKKAIEDANNNVLTNDTRMNELIAEIIDIFVNVEGVELVRLSGMTRHLKNITGFMELPSDAVDNIIQKLKNAGLIDWQYVMRCPYCGEIIYQIKERDNRLPKLCDSCKSMFNLVDGDTLFDEKKIF
jgi:uncharacterized protein with PIN domain